MHFVRCFNELILRNARNAGAAVTAVSAALLGGALVFQYGFGMAPCELCIFQRWPHGVAILLGLGVAGLSRQPKRAAILLALTGLVYALSTALGVYHTGVEHHWWASALEACKTGINMSGTDLLAQIEASKAVRCDVVPWSLFGISMAGYNAIISAGMVVYTFIAAIAITRRANGF